MTTNNELIEKLAALQHEVWAHWTKYMLDTLAPLFGNNIMTENQVRAIFELVPAEGANAEHIQKTKDAFATIDRWRRQIETPYADLTEKEKDSDREWAEKALDTVRGVESSVWVHEGNVVPERLRRLTEDAIMVERARVSSILSGMVVDAMAVRDLVKMDLLGEVQTALAAESPPEFPEPSIRCPKCGGEAAYVCWGIQPGTVAPARCMAVELRLYQQPTDHLPDPECNWAGAVVRDENSKLKLQETP